MESSPVKGNLITISVGDGISALAWFRWNVINNRQNPRDLLQADSDYYKGHHYQDYRRYCTEQALKHATEIFHGQPDVVRTSKFQDQPCGRVQNWLHSVVMVTALVISTKLATSTPVSTGIGNCLWRVHHPGIFQATEAHCAWPAVREYRRWFRPLLEKKWRVMRRSRPCTRTAGIYWVIVCQRSGSDTGRLKGKMGCFFFFIIRFAGIPINMRYAGIQARIVCRAPQLFGSTSTIDRFGESFRDGKYSSVSCLLAVLLLTVPHPCPAIC